MTVTTLSKAEATMNGFVSVAKLYDAKYELEDCADGQFLTVYTTNRDDAFVPKVEVAVWTDSDTKRVHIRAQWLTVGAQANQRIKNNEIDDHIEIAASERAADWV